jgi:hypothetical protein
MKNIFSLLSKKFFIRLFLVLIGIIIIQKIIGVSHITDTMTIGSMGFIVSIIGLYTAEKMREKL